MELSRRELLALLGAAELESTTATRLQAQSDDVPRNFIAGVRLEPFVDPLFLLPQRKPDTVTDGLPRYTMRLSEFRQKVHRDLPPTLVWGFEGTSPGPTIVAERDRGITVDWLNRLPLRHRLAVDHTLHGAEKNLPEVRTTIHLHGGHVSAENDGHPEKWVTPGQQQRTVYPNKQIASSLWYHDHSMGITRLNAMMGLAGFYLIHDPEEDKLGLPSGHYDVPLLIQDRILDARGQIAYPVSQDPESPWVPEFLGTHILVNGRVTPYFEVEPRKYRFRLLNASNSRSYQLTLIPGQEMIQIGSDGGLLAEPVGRRDLFIAPGERVEIVVDFRGREGRRIMMVNNAPSPFPAGGGPVPGMVMQFRVERPLRQAADRSQVPATLSQVSRLPEASAAKTRNLKLIEIMPMNGQSQRLLLDGRRFMDPITEDPKNGSIEVWELVNTTADAHPIHVHAVHFQLLDRRPFDVRRQQSKSEIVFTGKARQAAPEECGWKDTILCPPGQVTRIVIPFRGEPGTFVWHCHMLEHEDNEMMRPYSLRT